MKQLTVGLLLACGILVATPIYTFAADCSGGWNRLPNYKKGSGGACRQMGLDSKRGTCQPGQMYETLCDDSSGGKYRICQGQRQCSGGSNNYSRPAPPQNSDCTRWDYQRNQPCPPGYVNNDCRGGCQ